MKVLGIVLLFLLIFVGATLFAGLLWWVGLGILANIFNAPNLAITYWQSVVVALIANILLGGIGNAVRSKD